MSSEKPRSTQGFGAGQAFLTPKEVAEVLRRDSVKAVYRLIDADPTFPRLQLPSKGEGKSGGLLIPREAFERWLRDHTEGMRGPLRLAVVPATSTASITHSAPHALNGAAS